MSAISFLPLLVASAALGCGLAQIALARRLAKKRNADFEKMMSQTPKYPAPVPMSPALQAALIGQMTTPPPYPPQNLPQNTGSQYAGNGQYAAYSQQQANLTNSATYAQLQQMIMRQQNLYGLPVRHPAVSGLVLIADALRLFPDPGYAATMGFRSWVFDYNTGLLRSPSQGTPWQDTELRCEFWEENEVVRGASGIHAHLVPHDWQTAGDQGYGGQGFHQFGDGAVMCAPTVLGLVERFGRYVLGTEGWRAEWVVIRALHAPSKAVAMALQLSYPEVEITHGDR